MVSTQAAKDAHKVMRRGTRACRECRRRKIRCIYDDDKHDICQECTLHERQCIKQGIVRGGNNGNTTSNVKVQVTRFESAVEKLARDKKTAGRESKDSATLSHRDQDAADLAIVEQQLKGRSPIYSLFDNEFIAQDLALPAYGPEVANQIQFLNSDLSDREKLLSTIEHIPNVLQVTNYASEWWISWREQHFALRKTAGSLTLNDFVKQKLSSDRVVEVSLGLMALAMALGQIRPGVDDSAINLPAPPGQLMNHILTAVDQIVCDSEKYKTETEVILLYMMRGKHHTENNQLRKAWLRIRQGIRCAQAMGYGIHQPIVGQLSDEDAEKQRFIAAIFEVDHLISMVLGFPYAQDPAFTDARALSVLLNPTIRNEELKMRALRRVVAVTAGNINDRNASGNIIDEITESTQGTLEMAANCMPPGWWDILSQPLSGVAQHRYESIMAQSWFWIVQSYLHLPYVIKPSQTPASRRFRHLGLEGARNLMRTFNYLRTEPAISVYMCNCDDFQALLGACILLVGVVQNLSEGVESSSDTPESDPYVRDGDVSIDADLALIEDLKDIFRYRMNTQGGGISKQGLAVLDELTSLLYEDEEVTASNTTFKGDMLAFEIDLTKRQKTIMLPYFGTIKIELTRKLPKRRPQDFSQHMVLTPPRSIDGSSSDCSPNGCLPLDGSLNAPYDSTAVCPTGFQPNMPLVSDMTSAYPDNGQQFFADMGSFDHGMQNMEIPAISWEQWENYMFDQELNQDWNPGLQWNDPILANQ